MKVSRMFVTWPPSWRGKNMLLKAFSGKIKLSQISGSRYFKTKNQVALRVVL